MVCRTFFQWGNIWLIYGKKFIRIVSMLEKLYPQFLYSLQPYLSKQEFIYFLNTSKKEFGEFRCEFIIIRLKEEKVDQFIHDEDFRSFLFPMLRSLIMILKIHHHLHHHNSHQIYYYE